MTFVLFFVSMIVIYEMERGNLRGRKGDLCGRRRPAWKGKNAWKSMEGCGDRRTDRRKASFLFIYTPVITVSQLSIESRRWS